MWWEDPRILPYASPTYFGEILDLPAFPANWKKSRLWQQAKVNNRQVKCLGLGKGSGLFSTISAPAYTGARGTAARSQGRAPLCNTWIVGSSYLMPLAAPGDGSRGRSHWLLEPWLLEGDSSSQVLTQSAPVDWLTLTQHRRQLQDTSRVL